MTNDIKTGFLVYDKDALGGRPYWDDNGWHESIEDCDLPFRSVEKALVDIRCILAARFNLTIIDLTGKQVWPDVAEATGSTEVEALRKQVADLTAEVARLKDQRRVRIATAALQGLLACPNVHGSSQNLAEIAIDFADALIAKLDGKED